jgi:BTB/POZ domain-containing protein
MFKRSFRSNQDAGRVDKAGRLTKKNGSVRDPQKLSRLQRSLTEQQQQQQQYHDPGAAPPEAPSARSKNNLAPSPIVTLTVGREGRLFAAHEDVLRQAPFFEAACRDHHFRDAQSKRISLPDEEPEVFSAVLEYLYKGDYYPRLMHNRQRNSWELEDARGALPTPRSSPHPDNNTTTPYSGRAAASPMSAKTTMPGTPSGLPDATVFVAACGDHILRDTVVYCAAERYGLEELKRLALRKQGLQAGIDVATILRSAQYAYAHTPDTDSRLRAHYLALIIRCRKTFKRSGTMQAEMERGGSKLYFDLFVAMCNHLDDVIDVGNARSPRTV